ncbi:MAG: alpha/beta hydrolase [Acetobacteraceae bacterium]
MTENHTMIPSHPPGLRLFVRHLPARRPTGAAPVLYVHGATFPSALSIGHRFDGRSWEDDLAGSGFDAWAFDFHGFGSSDPFPEMTQPAEAHPPLGATPDGADQIERVARFILEESGASALSIIAHSWGTIAAGLFASRCPALVERLVFFAPITRRDGRAAPVLPAWSQVTLNDQWTRFVADVPAGEAPVLSRRHFAEWGERYLAADTASAERNPPAVRVPSGPRQGIADAWAGKLGYDPAAIRAPVAIIRGAWDSLCTDADAAGLFQSLTSSPVRRDVKISRATHLMHLESGRFALYRETAAFLAGGDLAPMEAE